MAPILSRENSHLQDEMYSVSPAGLLESKMSKKREPLVFSSSFFERRTFAGEDEKKLTLCVWDPDRKMRRQKAEQNSHRETGRGVG